MLKKRKKMAMYRSQPRIPVRYLANQVKRAARAGANAANRTKKGKMSTWLIVAGVAVVAYLMRSKITAMFKKTETPA